MQKDGNCSFMLWDTRRSLVHNIKTDWAEMTMDNQINEKQFGETKLL